MKRESLKDGKRYDLDYHRAWIDQNNSGISHFGMDPSHLRRDLICFDVFQLRSAITKKLMLYLREFILKQSCDLMDRFYNKVLNKFWGE